MKKDELVGRQFSRLTVLSQAPSSVDKDGRKRSLWNVRCRCGTEKAVLGRNLTKGLTRSCGCLRREVVAETGRNAARRGADATRRQQVVDWVIFGKPVPREVNRVQKRWVKSRVAACALATVFGLAPPPDAPTGGRWISYDDLEAA